MNSAQKKRRSDQKRKRSDPFELFAMAPRPTLAELEAESEQLWLDDIGKKLRHGSGGDGATLDAIECRVLMEMLKRLPKNKKRVGRPSAADRRYQILLYVADLESTGTQTEAAVTAAMERFGIKRAAVYEALRSESK